MPTGPLVAALLAAKGLSRQSLIATHATCLVIQHGLKILAFGLIGFSFRDWLPLLAAMILSGVAGSHLGTRLLDRMPERVFRRGLSITMAVLAGSMLWNALNSLLDP